MRLTAVDCCSDMDVVVLHKQKVSMWELATALGEGNVAKDVQVIDRARVSQ